MSVLSQTVSWLSAIVIAIPLNVASAAPPVNETVELVPDLSRLDSRPGIYLNRIDMLTKGASIEQLAALRRHENWGVALHAAWEALVRRPVRAELQETGDASKETRSRSLQRWLGIVEGRLKVTLPEAWEAIALGAVLGNGPSGKQWPFYFPAETCDCLWANPMAAKSEDDGLEPPEDFAGDWLLVNKGVTWQRDGHILRLSRNAMESVSFDLRWYEDRWLDGNGDLCGGRAFWHRHGNYDFVGIMRGFGGHYEIAAVDRGTGKHLWTARVQGGGFIPGMTGLPFSSGHCVDIVVTGDTLLLFGRHFFAVYLEGFDVKTGKATGRFSSVGVVP